MFRCTQWLIVFIRNLTILGYFSNPHETWNIVTWKSNFEDFHKIAADGTSTTRGCGGHPSVRRPFLACNDTWAPISWLSLVLKVGLSESINQLQTGARWWFSGSYHQTQLMVLISVNLNSHDADIAKRTSFVNRRVGVTTRGRETRTLACTKSAQAQEWSGVWRYNGN
ncbi:hypothetical protein N7454_006285 [Penicillium verhagenii]|nr:hypothetical protein N7454_006285 [Penicillium verhagenii]